MLPFIAIYLDLVSLTADKLLNDGKKDLDYFTDHFILTWPSVLFYGKGWPELIPHLEDSSFYQEIHAKKRNVLKIKKPADKSAGF